MFVHFGQVVENHVVMLITRVVNAVFFIFLIGTSLSGQVSRVMKKLTGLTPVNFILEMRLQKSRQLLEAKVYLSVDEVRDEI